MTRASLLPAMFGAHPRSTVLSSHENNKSDENDGKDQGDDSRQARQKHGVTGVLALAEDRIPDRHQHEAPSRGGHNHEDVLYRIKFHAVLQQIGLFLVRLRRQGLPLSLSLPFVYDYVGTP